MRVGRCPFHHPQPISSENSTNGVLDATGTPLGSSSPCFTMSGGRASTGSPSLSPPKKRQYKRGWSLEEHYFFLQGLHVFGHGSWKKIELLVKSRDPTQIQSHAQKFQERQRRTTPNTKRSINDVTLESQEMVEIHRLLKDTELKSRFHQIDIAERLQESSCRQSTSCRHTRNEMGAIQNTPVCHQDFTETTTKANYRTSRRASSATDISGIRNIGCEGYNQTGQEICDSTASPNGTQCITSNGSGISHLLNPTRSHNRRSRESHSTALYTLAKGSEHVLVSPRTITDTGLQPCDSVINQVQDQPTLDNEIGDIQFDAECPVDENCRRRHWVDGGHQTQWQDCHSPKKRRLNETDKYQMQGSLKLGFQICSADVLGNMGEGFLGNELFQIGFNVDHRVDRGMQHNRSKLRETSAVSYAVKRDTLIHKGINTEYREFPVEFEG